MNFEEKNFDFSKQPGKYIEDIKRINSGKPLISIITAIYNGKEYFEQTYNSVQNQTFPFWEWIIVNDGSTEEGIKEYLESFAKKDSRIKLYHKENEGLPKTRDYALERSNCDYIYILDADDLIDKTYLECCYWSMETNKDATWVYSDMIGFQDRQYLWDQRFFIRKEKKENIICGNTLIRKKPVLEAGGYSKAPNGVYEDWHLWLRLLAKGYKPMKLSYYGFWYRRRDGVLKNINKSKNTKAKAMSYIKEEAKKVKSFVKAIEFPTTDEYNYDAFPYEFNWDRKPIYEKGKKQNVLFIIPWLKIGGADKFYVDLINNLDKSKYNITVVTTEVCKYVWRQLVEDNCEYFDMTTFLRRKDWAAFLHYIIKSRNIDLVFSTNSFYGYYVIPWLKYKFPNVIFTDYLHNAVYNWRNGGYPRDSVAISKYLDCTYTCTNKLINIMENDMNRKAKNSKCVYIGVDTEDFNPEKIIIEKNDFSKYKDKKIVLFICRIDEIKRPVLMLKILEQIIQKQDDVVFFVVGDGPELDKIKKMSKKMNLENNIVFWGAKSNNETKEFYKISDLLLICSFVEGLTITAYEALSMGVPVVSADVGGQGELINDSVGRLIKCRQNIKTDFYNYNYDPDEIKDYVNAILEIINSSNEISIKCRERVVNNFDFKNSIKQMDQEFTRLIQNGIKVDKKIIDNEEIAINYLILYFELNRCFYYDDQDLDNPKKLIKYYIKQFLQKYWKFPPYRWLVKFSQKIGLTKFIRKLRR